MKKIIKLFLLCISLFLGLVIPLFIYVVYNKVAVGNAANTESRNIDTLRAGIKNIYGGSFDYYGVREEILLKARVVPDSMKNADGTSIINSFGGIVHVNATTLKTTDSITKDSNAFTISYTKIPQEHCAKFVTVSSSSFSRITIDNKIIKDDTHEETKNINFSVLMAQCESKNISDLNFLFTSF